ncbi:hypothetical protein SNEBB_000325 [Seison nebaliae]|nr:hypothetical protein SNEBB_000325 [Seison nebaliae]
MDIPNDVQLIRSPIETIRTNITTTSNSLPTTPLSPLVKRFEEDFVLNRRKRHSDMTVRTIRSNSCRYDDGLHYPSSECNDYFGEPSRLSSSDTVNVNRCVNRIVKKQIDGKKLEDGERNMLTRELARKQSHNEIEKKRRIQINDRIEDIRKLLPEYERDAKPNKGSILKSAVEYIRKVQEEQSNMAKVEKENILLRNYLNEFRVIIESHEAIMKCSKIPFDGMRSSKLIQSVQTTLNIPMYDSNCHNQSQQQQQQQQSSSMPSSTILGMEGSLRELKSEPITVPINHSSSNSSPTNHQNMNVMNSLSMPDNCLDMYQNNLSSTDSCNEISMMFGNEMKHNSSSISLQQFSHHHNSNDQLNNNNNNNNNNNQQLQQQQMLQFQSQQNQNGMMNNNNWMNPTPMSYDGMLYSDGGNYHQSYQFTS